MRRGPRTAAGRPSPPSPSSLPRTGRRTRRRGPDLRSRPPP
jgi:hypothetical protein